MAGWKLAGLALVLLLMAVPASAEPGDALVLIANAASPEPREISLRTVRQLYLGSRTHLARQRIQCFDLVIGAPEHEAFVRRVLHMSQRDLTDYWVEQALSGGGLPPREVSDPEDMIRQVGRVRGALGYARLRDVHAFASKDVRIVGVLVDGSPVLPGEPGYPLR